MCSTRQISILDKSSMKLCWAVRQPPRNLVPHFKAGCVGFNPALDYKAKDLCGNVLFSLQRPDCS
jgi:hypothetical protein